MTRLSDRLNQAKDAVDLNVDAAVLSAQEAGLSVDRSVVYKALKGNHAKKPADDTLRGFEAVFGVPVTELRELLDLPAGELEPYQPPAFANRLNRDQRKALNELIRTIVSTSVEVAVPTASGTSHAPAPTVTGERKLRAVAQNPTGESAASAPEADAAAKKSAAEQREAIDEMNRKLRKKGKLSTDD